MKTNLGLAMALLVAASPSIADSLAETESLVRNAANFGHAVEGMVHGQPVVAVPVGAGSGRCGNVGVIYASGRGRQYGGPRIENYAACKDAVERLDEVSPALPDEAEFKQIVMMTVRGAIRYGEQPSSWQNYRVEAHRLSPPDARGCAQVETVISSQGLLVSYNVGLLCP